MPTFPGFNFENLHSDVPVNPASSGLKPRPAFDTTRAAELGAETLMAMFPQSVTDKPAIHGRLLERL
jgi:hypothetical protein